MHAPARATYTAARNTARTAAPHTAHANARRPHALKLHTHARCSSAQLPWGVLGGSKHNNNYTAHAALPGNGCAQLQLL